MEEVPDNLSVMSLGEIENDLNKQAKKWQKILRLQDWNVRVDLRRRHEMSEPDCLGLNTIFEERKDSIIELASPMDLDTYKGFLDNEEGDYDVNLVHELLHIHFAPLGIKDDESPKGVAQEQIINILSRTLVSLYRKGKERATQVLSDKVSAPPLPAEDGPKQNGPYL